MFLLCLQLFCGWKMLFYIQNDPSECCWKWQQDATVWSKFFVIYKWGRGGGTLSTVKCLILPGIHCVSIYSRGVARGWNWLVHNFLRIFLINRIRVLVYTVVWISHTQTYVLSTYIRVLWKQTFFWELPTNWKTLISWLFKIGTQSKIG